MKSEVRLVPTLYLSSLSKGGKDDGGQHGEDQDPRGGVLEH